MPRALRTLAAAFLVFVSAALPAAGWAAEKSILVFGDSLSAAYGIAQSRGWVALLGERLKREGSDYSVVNASISGETTAGGLARIDAALEKHEPEVVVLALGGNDGLRGLPVTQMQKNLSAMVERARRSGARVLLVGVRIPPNYGPVYTEAFEGAFREVAKRHGTALLPFMLDGVADKADLFQPDRIHPTQEAQPLIERNVWKALKPLLK